MPDHVTIQEREYVEKLEGRFHPTGWEKPYNDLLIEGGLRSFHVTYTARMEEQLDNERKASSSGLMRCTTSMANFREI